MTRSEELTQVRKSRIADVNAAIRAGLPWRHIGDEVYQLRLDIIAAKRQEDGLAEGEYIMDGMKYVIVPCADLWESPEKQPVYTDQDPARCSTCGEWLEMCDGTFTGRLGPVSWTTIDDLRAKTCRTCSSKRQAEAMLRTAIALAEMNVTPDELRKTIHDMRDESLLP